MAGYAVSREGFTIPRPEVLLILKHCAYQDRRGTPKGEKDKLDIIRLLASEEIDLDAYKKILNQYQLTAFLPELKNLITSTAYAAELNLNRYQFSKLKRKLLAKL